jgi:hypothetical protein
LWQQHSICFFSSSLATPIAVTLAMVPLSRRLFFERAY